MHNAITHPAEVPRQIVQSVYAVMLRRADGAFGDGSLSGIERWLGSGRERPRSVRSVLLVAMIGWVPLVVLVLLQSAASQADSISSFVDEVGAHARYLVATPLLFFAGRGCARRLNAIVQNFAESGIVPTVERAWFDGIVASTRRLIDSKVAGSVIIAVAYILVAMTVYSQPFSEIPAWHRTEGATPYFSPAGWWHVLVSLPLLLALLLGWMWRLVLWARLLWLVAGLSLGLLASHPDRTAGLGFLGYSLRAFWVVALACATIVAGRAAHLVLLNGALTTRDMVFCFGLLMTLLVLLCAPLFSFTPTLMRALQSASLEYGALADRVGTAFEAKWIGRDRHIDASALEKPDFSATTDLYAIVANIYAQKLVPIDLMSIAVLGGAMLVPFVPVMFLALPANEILAGLKTLLF